MPADTAREPPGDPLTVALVSARAARDLDEDLPPLEAALRARGVAVRIACWDDASVDWSAVDLALLRSTWDYVERLEEFLQWAERTARVTRLANPPALIRWNTDKHYLAELAHARVPAVASTFVEPADSPARAAGAVAGFLERDPCAEFVVKPAVGAGSRDAQRYPRTAAAAATAHAQRLLQRNRSVLLQPFLDSVDVHGETALIYFAGRFSHAICKGSLLRPEAPPTDALFAPETITPRIPGADELEVGALALAALAGAPGLAHLAPPLYARVDLLRDSRGAPCVLEMELTEPSLFFQHAPGSAERFAAAIVACIAP